MGNCETRESAPNKTYEPIPYTHNEMASTSNRGLPLQTYEKTKRTICKIIINNIFKGTGFFMKTSDSKKYLITNNSIISKDEINENIEIELYNNRKMNLNINDRLKKFLPSPKNITIIEIKNDDEIYKDILFLNYDRNSNNDYSCYKDKEIFVLYFSKEGLIQFDIGKIILISGYEFDCNIPNDKKYDGSPIFLFNSNVNLNKAIGIYKEPSHSNNLSSGIFIREIIYDENTNLIASSNNINKPPNITNSAIINGNRTNTINETINKPRAININVNPTIKNTSNNGIYIPYSCIPSLENNDLSFSNPQTQE